MENKFRVFLNPGHDRNKDPGAVNKDTGLKECDVVYEVGVAVMDLLIHKGYDVMLVQNDSLERVVDKANEFQANLFVSLHCDANDNSLANGTTAYWFKDSRASKAGNAIRTNICKELGTADRRYLHDCKFYVCKSTAMPACLIEMFFISNLDDVRRWENNKDGLVKAIADGIDTYFKE